MKELTKKVSRSTPEPTVRGEITSRSETPAIVIGEPGLVHCLGTEKIPVQTVSEDRSNISAWSRYSRKHHIFGQYDSDEFVDDLCELGRNLSSRPVLMSHDDRALLTISDNREKLSPHFRFLLPEKQMVEMLLDKLQFCRLCNRYDLPAPTSIEINDPEELHQVWDAITPPYLIKPGYRHYWYSPDFSRVVGTYQKAYVCHTFQELESLYSRIAQIHPAVVIQEFITGTDDLMYDVNLHVTEEGAIDSYVIARKLRVYPPVAGWTCYSETVIDDELFEVCRQIIDRLNLVGLLNLQFKQDSRTGEYKLIEIHVRSSILDYQGAAAGENIPANYFRYLIRHQNGGTTSRAVSRSALNGDVNHWDPSSIPDVEKFSDNTFYRGYSGVEGEYARSNLRTEQDPHIWDIHDSEKALPVRPAADNTQQDPGVADREAIAPYQTAGYRAGVSYVHLARDLRLLLKSRGELSTADVVTWLLNYRKVDVFDGLMLKDPVALAMGLLKAVRSS